MMRLEDKKKSFDCEICGDKHEFFRTFIVPEPRVISEMTDSEKKERLFIRNHLYLVDESIAYSKARLYINIENVSDYVSWELYVRLDSIEEYLEKTRHIRTASPLFVSAKIESGIPMYEELNDLSVEIVYNIEELDVPPRIKIPSGVSLIALESINGVSRKRLVDLNKRLYHPQLADVTRQR